MLTTDLVRVSRKGGMVQPRYVAVHSKLQLERAKALIDLYASHVGSSRGMLEDAISDLISDRTDFKLQRGLSKLLSERCEFLGPEGLNPGDIRQFLFEKASQDGPVTGDGTGVSRDELIGLAAQAWKVTPREIEEAMYGDLRTEERLTKMDNVSAEHLLKRYNTALVQGVLLRTHRIRVVFHQGDPLRLQAVFRALRFYRLIHEIFKTEEGIEVRIDGPLSLFRQSTKYGLQMAMFFPALALAEGWELFADLEWDGERCGLQVSSGDGLSSHYRDRGTWRRDEEVAFEAWLGAKAPDWQFSDRPSVFKASEGEVWIPDFVLEHETGFCVYIEWIGYWKKRDLGQRLKRLNTCGQVPRLVLLSTRLAVDEEVLEALPDQVIPIKGVLPGKKIVEAAEALRSEDRSG